MAIGENIPALPVLQQRLLGMGAFVEQRRRQNIQRPQPLDQFRVGQKTPFIRRPQIEVKDPVAFGLLVAVGKVLHAAAENLAKDADRLIFPVGPGGQFGPLPPVQPLTLKGLHIQVAAVFLGLHKAGAAQHTLAGNQGAAVDQAVVPMAGNIAETGQSAVQLFGVIDILPLLEDVRPLFDVAEVVVRGQVGGGHRLALHRRRQGRFILEDAHPLSHFIADLRPRRRGGQQPLGDSPSQAYRRQPIAGRAGQPPLAGGLIPQAQFPQQRLRD